eukprot:3063241-Pleurochrysis_carterae.AAC.1
MRSRSASLRARSLASSFLSRAKDFNRSLAGGLPSICLHDEELPGIRRQVNAHGGKCAQERVEACTMLDCEERLNEEQGVGSKGCGEDGDGVNGNGGEEGCNGGMGTSELGGGEGPDSRVVAWRH